MASFTFSGMVAYISVSMKPGQIALTVTWERANSKAAVLVNPMMPDLAAE